MSNVALISIIGFSASGLPKTSSVNIPGALLTGRSSFNEPPLEVTEGEEEGSELVTFNQRPFNV